MTLQEMVNEYADANNITREAIAEAIGVSRSSLFNKVRGTFEFNLGEAYKLAHMLGITLDEFYALLKAA